MKNHLLGHKRRHIKLTPVAGSAAQARDEDKIIGANIRYLRLFRGYSARQLGESIELSPQQVLKFERGENAIKASQLRRLSLLLNAPISSFWDSHELAFAVRDDVSSGFDGPKEELAELIVRYGQLDDEARSIVREQLRAATKPPKAK